MSAYRIRFNMDRAAFDRAACIAADFGERNAGVIVEATTAADAVRLYNDSRLPGARLNPFYLAVDKVSI